ncbi:uncharacterized protein LOC113232320 [Hyposmocoma kahamanoa]|uniref:uncharacterized protein LOC113232320 n=1 Tax=Hyposmocoma kahamanoa TaxID=1477025 RepID=UPI000E6D8633|nr:uncharacterized protein LOC113232320 [Hyposmocoma kahamanoa]
MHLLFVLLLVLFEKGAAIKCFHCVSANNSACLDMNLHKMNAIVPIVNCAMGPLSLAKNNIDISKDFFCRKIIQTILYPDHTPEIRVIRGCGWVKSKRSCYTNDNKDHLETVCQCFDDMCNAASVIGDVKIIRLIVMAAIMLVLRTWRTDF